MSEQNVLLNRISKIEWELRFWRVVAVLAVGYFAVVVMFGAKVHPEMPGVLQAKEFQLVDDSGSVRATLQTVGYGTLLRMFSGSKNSEIAIGTNNVTSFIHLYSDNRSNFASIEANASGGFMGLSRDSGDGKALAHVAAGAEGSYLKLQPLNGEEVFFPPE